MTDNPYAAPESAQQSTDVFVHIKAIRAVARIFRIFGWIGFVIFGPLTLFAWLACVLHFWHTGGQWVALTEASEFRRTLVITLSLLFPLMLYFSWNFVRIGKGLLAKSPHAYLEAKTYSYLNLLGFPFLTLVGLYSLVKLRHHWQLYCLLAPDET